MNVLFLTLVNINSINERGIYTDLMRCFRDKGDTVTIVNPVERSRGVNTNFQCSDGVNILQVKTFNIQKTNIIEKGLATLLIEYQYLSAIKKYFSNVKFDLILYSTPPITFYKVVEFIKQRDNAYSYLLLKDIFPQNAIDMRLIKEGSFIHRQFRKKEKKLYKISDTIGCMSPANVAFLLKHNPEVNLQKVEVNPNSIEPLSILYSHEEKAKIRKKYQIPLDKKIFIYGGNLGKPQGVNFLCDTIGNVNHDEVFFLIIGNGTEFEKIEKWFTEQKPKNAKLLQHLPKKDYDSLLGACDVGLIFLHPDFLIPNFPSRMLSYLEMRLPVVAATDKHTDIGDIVETANCGYKVLAGDIKKMESVIYKMASQDDLKQLGENAWKLLQDKYLAIESYHLIVDKIRKNV